VQFQPSAHPSSLPPLVQQAFDSPSLERPAGGVHPTQLLKVSEAFWQATKDASIDQSKQKSPPIVVTPSSKDNHSLPHTADFDCCICGGTLGVFLALALQSKGYNVAIVEKRLLKGRSQEWNINRKELFNLEKCGLLTAAELEEAITTEFNPIRIGFPEMDDIWVEDVLNLGVSPEILLERMKLRFLDKGGVLLEKMAFKTACVYEDGVEVALLPVGALPEVLDAGDINRSMGESSSSSSSGSSSDESNSYNGTLLVAAEKLANSIRSKKKLTTKLLIDCMGHYSPIVKQMRGKQQPDGVVLVVGGALEGIPSDKNTSADLLYTFEDSEDDIQLFWEAFPADGGEYRTVYMFCYSDCHPSRPSFSQLLDMYLKKLPQYQSVSPDSVRPKRLLLGGFPCYKSSPLKPGFDRIIQIGDASATQSPLSFGGFGSMIRHLPRLVAGVDQALQDNKLSRRHLSKIHPYQPSLSAAWLFQRAMSLKPGQTTTQGIPANHINRLMRCNMIVMKLFGDRVMRPFLQDTLQFLPLAATMGGMLLKDPIVVCRVLFQLGPMLIAEWFVHFISMLVYTFGNMVLWPMRRVVKWYWFQRMVYALRWGCGGDYEYHGGKSNDVGDGAAAASG